MRFTKPLFALTLANLAFGLTLNASQTFIGSEFAPPSSSTLDLMTVFESCPVIYTLLILLSLASVVIWLYSLLTLKLSNMMPKDFITKIRNLMAEKRFEEALATCKAQNYFSSGIMASGLAAHRQGPQIMIEAMQSEGKRRGNAIWQQISFLNEIATVSPMLGLLGTVLGLFFAFYDPHRTTESIAAIFDGLGIAVGTTVVGLIVAILSMIFYTTLKYRVINLMNTIENELVSIVSVADLQHPPKKNP